MAKTAKLTLQKICAFVFTNLQIDQWRVMKFALFQELSGKSGGFSHTLLNHGKEVLNKAIGSIMY